MNKPAKLERDKAKLFKMLFETRTRTYTNETFAEHLKCTPEQAQLLIDLLFFEGKIAQGYQVHKGNHRRYPQPAYLPNDELQEPLRGEAESPGL